jgi:ubiquinone/menaquinone biosynthesis C-methylase UbiE
MPVPPPQAANPQPVPPPPQPQPIVMLNEETKHQLLDRYYQTQLPSLEYKALFSYATVRDFCDSVDHLPQICYLNGDLKNVQRPWTVKAILANVPLGGKLLEIGGGQPLVASLLTELGYHVTLVDPYEGAGNGPTEYEAYVHQYPKVELVKSQFDATLMGYADASFDCIYSISVLEHVPIPVLAEVYAGIEKFLRPNGHSLHCVDLVTQGDATEFHTDVWREVVYQQTRLKDPNVSRSDTDAECFRLLAQAKDDLETFYLSATGHNLWRGGISYDSFPFRRVISAQTCVAL